MDRGRRVAGIVAIVAASVWLVLFILQFSYRSNAITIARWSAFIVLGIAWFYASSRPR